MRAFQDVRKPSHLAFDEKKGILPDNGNDCDNSSEQYGIHTDSDGGYRMLMLRYYS